MQNSLADEIEVLRERLQRASAMDPDLLSILSRVVHDVTTLTDEHSVEERVKLSERLEALAARFESSHPELAGGLRRLVNALADLGV